MGAEPRIDLYCEDSGHEQFTRALISRLAREQLGGVPIVETVSGRGGHGRALTEFRGWQRKAQKGGLTFPDLLVVVIDTNCSSWNEARAEVEGAVDRSLFPRHVVGCPDPHVERWCLADPAGFKLAVGASPRPDPDKCERNVYKRLLRQSIQDAGEPILTNEMEFAPDIVAAMDLYRAGKRQPALGKFVQDLRAAFTTLAAQ